jgi:hypothetical protein
MSEKGSQKGIEAWLLANRAQEHTLGLFALSLVRWIKTTASIIHPS